MSAPVRDVTVDPVLLELPDDTERERYRTLVETLTLWKGLFQGRRVMDFGASVGTSMVALLRLGAREVVGVEPELARVERGQVLLAAAAPGAKVSLIHTPDTGALPYRDGEFNFILANAVLEHIPQPRERYIRELWRMLAPGGHVMINETPNKYLPKEMHTTGLWFNHFLPKEAAHRRALRHGRFDPNRTDWDGSGWRGLGYFELVKPIRNYQVVPDQTKSRHRLFAALGIPPSIVDPYPTWILRKVE